MATQHAMRRYFKLTALAAISLSLAGCAGMEQAGQAISGLTEYFSSDDNQDPPAALTEYTAELDIKELWKESIGKGADEQYLKLGVAVNMDRVFAADRKGLIEARSTGNGERVWEQSTDYAFSAGPGLGRQTVIMGTSHADVVAFDMGTGQQRWSTSVSSEVQSTPVVTNGIVIVRTTDGKITALREENGSVMWSVERNVPALSIRGTSNPLIFEDHILIGLPSGKLEALRLSDGKSLWESTVVMPSGRSEVERLVDLDADPAQSRGTVFVASIQGGTAGVSAIDGDIVWRNNDVSAYTGLNSDWRYLYVSDAQGVVWQLDQRSGGSLWKQQELKNRKLTAAVVDDSAVVVGDLEGYVHWLSTSDGRQLGRVQISKSPIEAAPVVVNGTVYVYAKDGTLAALKAR